MHKFTLKNFVTVIIRSSSSSSSLVVAVNVGGGDMTSSYKLRHLKHINSIF